MNKEIKTVISSLIILSFSCTSIITPRVQAQGMPVLPKPGVMVSLSPEFTPASIKAITIHPDNALEFDFIIDQGNVQLSADAKKEEYEKLAKYFLASLAIPEEDLWVNLSPYEKQRIIPDTFGKTEMGRDLLAMDYVLKQITASLIYPEEGLGKEFWNKVYEQAQKQFGSTQVPVNTFNKVWIVPDIAEVYEKGNTVFLIKSHLKVMLEEDYLSLEKNSGSLPPAGRVREGGVKDVNKIGSQIVREVILPAIEKEVNEGKNFATLRQLNDALILATWYKKALKDSLLGRVYADKGKVKGVEYDSLPPVGRVREGAVQTPDQIYQQYLKAFKKGVFNFIKEDTDRYTQEIIPRKYFSGGYSLENPAMRSQRFIEQVKTVSFAQASDVITTLSNNHSLDKASIALSESNESRSDLASVSREIPDDLGEGNDFGDAIWYNHRHKKLGADSFKAVLIRYPRQYKVLRNYLLDLFKNGKKELLISSIGAGDGREPASIAAYLLWLQDDTGPYQASRSPQDVALGKILREQLVTVRIVAIDYFDFDTDMKASLMSGRLFKQSYEDIDAVNMVNYYLSQVMGKKWIVPVKGDWNKQMKGLFVKYDIGKSDIIFSNETLRHLESDTQDLFYKEAQSRIKQGSLLLFSDQDAKEFYVAAGKTFDELYAGFVTPEGKKSNGGFFSVGSFEGWYMEEVGAYLVKSSAAMVVKEIEVEEKLTEVETDGELILKFIVMKGKLSVGASFKAYKFSDFGGFIDTSAFKEAQLRDLEGLDLSKGDKVWGTSHGFVIVKKGSVLSAYLLGKNVRNNSYVLFPVNALHMASALPDGYDNFLKTGIVSPRISGVENVEDVRFSETDGLINIKFLGGSEFSIRLDDLKDKTLSAAMMSIVEANNDLLLKTDVNAVSFSSQLSFMDIAEMVWGQTPRGLIGMVGVDDRKDFLIKRAAEIEQENKGIMLNLSRDREGLFVPGEQQEPAYISVGEEINLPGNLVVYEIKRKKGQTINTITTELQALGLRLIPAQLMSMNGLLGMKNTEQKPDALRYYGLNDEIPVNFPLKFIYPRGKNGPDVQMLADAKPAGLVAKGDAERLMMGVYQSWFTVGVKAAFNRIVARLKGDKASVSDAVGGINLNPAFQNLQIKRDGAGVPLPISQQNIDQINLEGLIPVIKSITPAINLPIFSEILGEAGTPQIS